MALLLIAGILIGIGIGIIMESLVTQVIALIGALDRAIPLLTAAVATKAELDTLKTTAQSLADQLQTKVAELNAALPPV